MAKEQADKQYQANISVPFEGSMDAMVTLRDDDDEALLARLDWWFVQLLDRNIYPKVMEHAPKAEPKSSEEQEAKGPPRKAAQAKAQKGGGDSDEVLVQRTSRDTMTYAVTEKGDKMFAKVKCGEWRAHGVKAWPEVFDPFGLEWDLELAGKTFELPPEIIAIKVMVEDGSPKKVMGFVVEDPA